MVSIHLSGALERVVWFDDISSRVVNTVAWYLSGLTLRPYLRKNLSRRSRWGGWSLFCRISVLRDIATTVV